MCPGKGGKDCSVGRTSWEGRQAENGTPYAIDSERAPATVHLFQLRFHVSTQRGRARNY